MCIRVCVCVVVKTLVFLLRTPPILAFRRPGPREKCVEELRALENKKKFLISHNKIIPISASFNTIRFLITVVALVVVLQLPFCFRLS